MELNMKDVLNAAAAATSEFVKNLYSAETVDENESAVTFETTITLLDKDSTPISVIRATKTNLEPAKETVEPETVKAEIEEPQVTVQETAEVKTPEAPAAANQETPAAPEAYRQPFPGYFGYPYGAIPVAEPNSVAVPGAYYGMPYPYAEAFSAGAAAPQQNAQAQMRFAPAAQPEVKTNADTVYPGTVDVQPAPEKAAPAQSTNQLGTPQLSSDSIKEATPNQDRDKVVSMPEGSDADSSDDVTSRSEKIDQLLRKYSSI